MEFCGFVGNILIQMRYSRVLNMKEYRTAGFVFTIILLFFDALIALYTAILSAILCVLNTSQTKVKSARSIFLFLLCYAIIHLVITIVLVTMRNTDLMKRKNTYLIFNTLLPVTGIGALTTFYCLYITYTSDFFGSTYDPDHWVVLPLVVLYCFICAINLILAVIAGITWHKQSE